MDRREISPQDLQVLRLIDNIAGRFEAEAGFPLPGIAAHDVLPEYATRFGLERIDESQMDELVQTGLLAVIRAGRDGNLYALTEAAESLLRTSRAA